MIEYSDEYKRKVNPDAVKNFNDKLNSYGMNLDNTMKRIRKLFENTDSMENIKADA